MFVMCVVWCGVVWYAFVLCHLLFSKYTCPPPCPSPSPFPPHPSHSTLSPTDYTTLQSTGPRGRKVTVKPADLISAANQTAVLTCITQRFAQTISSITWYKMANLSTTQQAIDTQFPEVVIGLLLPWLLVGKTMECSHV